MPCSQNTSSHSNAHGTCSWAATHARSGSSLLQTQSSECNAPAKAAFPPESSFFCLTAVSRNGLHTRSFLADALTCSMTFYAFYASEFICVCVCVCVCVFAFVGWCCLDPLLQWFLFFWEHEYCIEKQRRWPANRFGLFLLKIVKWLGRKRSDDHTDTVKVHGTCWLY